MLKLYGTPLSRARRCLWLLEELALPYQLVPIMPRSEEVRSSEYRALNPMGKVPTLVDGDLTLTESMAINLYLAQRYGGNWWPASAAEEAHLLQWTFFATTELDSLFFIIIYERMLKPEAVRIEAAAKQAEEMLARPLHVLEHALAAQSYLLGNEFSLADLNTAGVCTMGRRINFDYTAYPALNAWLTRCWSRPAFRKVDAMK